MASASESVTKWQGRASAAGQDYVDGARSPRRSQSQAAIAAKDVMVTEFNAAMQRGDFEKGLRESGDAGWFAGIEEKGQLNYPTGVSSEAARSKYVANSGRYDSARNAAASMPTGPKGSAQNLAKVARVVSALRAVKTGAGR